MTYPQPDALIETQALSGLLNDPTVRILDATYYVPPDPRNPREDYLNAHIPGALFFDIDAIADIASGLPHMLPKPGQFEEQVGALGIGNQHRLVIYDNHGVMSAARAWWMFRVFGHQEVSVLNGGLPKWRAEGRPVEAGEQTYPQAQYNASYQPRLVWEKNDVLAWLQTSQDRQLTDARSPGRFSGRDAEPRPGLRQGHIPGSVNLPWNGLIDPVQKTMLPQEQLVNVLTEAGIDPLKPTATSCGSGVTACVNALALYLLGNANVAVYDGSWAEWGADPQLPISSSIHASA